MQTVLELGFLIIFGAAFAFLVTTRSRVASYHRSGPVWAFCPAPRRLRDAVTPRRVVPRV